MDMTCAEMPFPGDDMGGVPFPGGDMGGMFSPGDDMGDMPVPGGDMGDMPLPGGDTPFPGGAAEVCEEYDANMENKRRCNKKTCAECVDTALLVPNENGDDTCGWFADGKCSADGFHWHVSSPVETCDDLLCPSEEDICSGRARCMDPPSTCPCPFCPQ